MTLLITGDTSFVGSNLISLVNLEISSPIMSFISFAKSPIRERIFCGIPLFFDAPLLEWRDAADVLTSLLDSRPDLSGLGLAHISSKPSGSQELLVFDLILIIRMMVAHKLRAGVLTAGTTVRDSETLFVMLLALAPLPGIRDTESGGVAAPRLQSVERSVR